MLGRWFCFEGGENGQWIVDRVVPVIGATLSMTRRLSVRDEFASEDTQRQGPPGWALRGVRSNERYTTRAEHDALTARQAGLDRPEATRAALIPIRKSSAWWALSQDQRRSIFEEQSGHVSRSLPYLPAIARRLYHCRDIPDQPFDFLTWFEFAPEHEGAFDELVALLRASAEWGYVDREVDIRVHRAPSTA